MGLQVEFELKNTDEASIEQANKTLESYGLASHFSFVSGIDNQAWLTEINTDPSSPQSHLKPDGRDLTMDELKEVFGMWMKEGTLSVDIGFNRVPQKTMKSLLDFTLSYADKLKQVSNIADLIERGTDESDRDNYSALSYLDTTFSKASYLLPRDKQSGDITSSGVLMQDVNGNLISLVNANVDSPMLAKKESQYINPDDNELAVDKQGHYVILFPLLPVNGDIIERVGNLYNDVYALGVRESFSSFVLQKFGNILELKEVKFNDFDEAKRALSRLTLFIPDRLVTDEGLVRNTQNVRDNIVRSNIEKTQAFILEHEPDTGLSMGLH